ncbi:5-oxoprolinase subunit PxpA [Aestuariibacter sp. AA17]|uniref:5-oxoprolinase subunit PxpA n=1 Tax=Fluctibacter corallii TaxID=2984329 RepID=A0ABT3A5L1_9ALTE|nr:5-oxoprolinase subunit PxpA [Aestuariibacter sp. AA17]MCV2883928.1 5-oxoprolinase subunit PxpA [Aestuariibacter sp. AA17]
MKLNSDLGESYGIWKMADDRAILPLIDMANIACGFHAGDAMVMRNTVVAAIENQVEIGAHPSYPDLQGFGRRSMRLPAEELHAMLIYQLSALDGIAQCVEGAVTYMKPHGALYNDMMKDFGVFQTVVEATSSFYRPIELVIQAGLHNSAYQQIASKNGVTLRYEAFADRRYMPSGQLTPREQQGAVLSLKEMVEQAKMLIKDGRVKASDGSWLALEADTLCVHGDSTDALQAIQQIRSLL